MTGPEIIAAERKRHQEAAGEKPTDAKSKIKHPCGWTFNKMRGETWRTCGAESTWQYTSPYCENHVTYFCTEHRTMWSEETAGWKRIPNAEGQGCRASRHTLDPLVGAFRVPASARKKMKFLVDINRLMCDSESQQRGKPRKETR